MAKNDLNESLPRSVIVELTRLTDLDRAEIQRYRGSHNQLGFGYQLMFVKAFNQFPQQIPLEVNESLLTFASLQLGIKSHRIKAYGKQQPVISRHQKQISSYLKLLRFNQTAAQKASKFLFNEAQRTEHSSTLLAKVNQFLKENRILKPAQSTLDRIINHQRRKVRNAIYKKVLSLLTPEQCKQLDALLIMVSDSSSLLEQLKQPPLSPSPKAFLALTETLNAIRTLNLTDLDISWLNNNYQRSLTKYVLRCSAHRLKELQPGYCYTALICFLKQLSLDTTDAMVNMYHKLMLKVYRSARQQMDDALYKQRKYLKQSQEILSTVTRIILDDTIEDTQLRSVLFNKISRKTLEAHDLKAQDWLTGKFSHVFHLVINRFSYLRQFSPALMKYLEFEATGASAQSLLEATQLLNQLNADNKRTLPDTAPLAFIPKKLRPLIFVDGQLNKKAWECIVLSKIEQEITIGNLTVKGSKRYDSFDTFFMPYSDWKRERSQFFQRANLPENPKDVPQFLTRKLNQAYDHFSHRAGITAIKLREKGLKDMFFHSFLKVIRLSV